MGIGSSGVANYANTRLALAIRTIALGNMGDFEVVSDDGVGLGLNFQTMTALDPRITFSRASNATVVGSDGLIQYAPHNLLTYSENFDNAVWVKADGTIVANSTVAPDGTITADTYTVGTSSTAPYQNTTIVDGNSYSISIHFHSSSTTPFIRIRVQTAAASTSAFINTSTKAFGTVLAQLSNAVVTDMGNGWYRASISYTPNTGDGGGTRSIGFSGVISNNSSTPATGTTLVCWGAQLNIGSLQPYYTTSVKNLLGYSQNFENAAWTKSNSSIDDTPVMGPLGFLGAEKLVENTAAGTHGFSVDTSSLSSTTQYTFSVYAKAGERTWVRLGLVDNLGIDGGRAWFDLATGVVGTVETNGAGSNINATITSIGAGWSRCRLTIQMNNGKSTLQSQVRLATANNVLSYTGDGTSGIYIFGAQLSDSASLDPYSYNFGTAPTSTAYYGPRFDYDPVTLAPKGLLIEEQRTNAALNSNTFNLSTGTTETLNATISPDGTQNASLITETTANGEHYSLDRGIAVTSGTTYVWSFYAKQGAGSDRKAYCRVATAATASVSFNLITGTGSVISSTNLVTYGTQQLSNGWWKCYIVFTAASTATAICRAQLIRASDNNSIYTGDGVSGLYLWGAQLEAGAFPTSYIPTTSASVTRAADNASMTGTNFSSWYNQSEGTICSQWMLGGDSTSINVYNINDGTGNNLIRARYNSAGSASDNAVIAGGSVPAVLTTSNQITLYSSYKNSMAYKQDDFARSSSGLLVTDNSGNIPTVTQMNIGCSASGTEQLNGHIQSIKYYPRRLANGDLQAITS